MQGVFNTMSLMVANSWYNTVTFMLNALFFQVLQREARFG